MPNETRTTPARLIAASRASLLAAADVIESAIPSAEILALHPTSLGGGFWEARAGKRPLVESWIEARSCLLVAVMAALADLDAAEARGELVGRSLGLRLHLLVRDALARHGVVRVGRPRARLNPRMEWMPLPVVGLPTGLERALGAVRGACFGAAPEQIKGVVPAPMRQAA